MMRRTSSQSVGGRESFCLRMGRFDVRERMFLQRLAVTFNVRARVASNVIEAMPVKNHL